MGVQVIVPPVINGRALTARAGSSEIDTVLVEGASANFFEIIGAEFAAGRPFTDVEDRAGAPVAIIGANLVACAVRRGLRGPHRRARRSCSAGETYYVVGELAPRKGGFFGENRQGQRHVASRSGTATRRFPQAENTVLYIQSKPGRREDTQVQAEAILRQLRQLGARRANDFNLSTSDQIIASFDSVSAAIGAVDGRAGRASACSSAASASPT